MYLLSFFLIIIINNISKVKPIVQGSIFGFAAYSHSEGQVRKKKQALKSVATRGVTIRYPHDTIRIAILESRYDTYRDTW